MNCLSLLFSVILVLTVQGTPQAIQKSTSKAKPKATKSESVKVPVVTVPAPLPSPTLSKEYKVLGSDALSALDSMAGSYTEMLVVYEPNRANAMRLISRAKYLAENDGEKGLYALLLFYYAQVEACKLSREVAIQGEELNLERSKVLGARGAMLELQKLQAGQRLGEELAENFKKCSEGYKKVHDSIDSYITRGGPEPNQPDKEQRPEIKEKETQPPPQGNAQFVFSLRSDNFVRFNSRRQTRGI